jgi:hypothetical protein
MVEPTVNSYAINITLSRITKKQAMALAEGVQALIDLTLQDSPEIMSALSVAHIKGFEARD